MLLFTSCITPISNRRNNAKYNSGRKSQYLVGYHLLTVACGLLRQPY